MQPIRRFIAAGVIGSGLLALSACEKPEGPLERAGKEVDSAAAKVGEKVDNAGNRIQDVAAGDKK